MKHLPLICGVALWLACGSLIVRAENFVASAEDRAKIEAALPREAAARPLHPRRLLMFTLNVGYGGHPSIQYANEAFTRMGQKLRLYETEVSQDPSIFEPARLRRFDAVCFNNTVGNCFTNAEWRRALLEFVTGGGGLLGFHGTTVAFTRWPGALEDWPEFGFMIGARGANHRDSDERAWLKVEDPRHPLTRAFAAEGFEFRDEYFRPQAPYSRERVRVLLSMDLAKTDLNASGPLRGAASRPDNDYAVAWIRNYGQGRVFYSTMAHNPYVFWNTNLLRFYLNAIQFALGDLPAPTTPSARLSPAMFAQEALGWRLAAGGRCFQNLTLFETIDQAAQLGLPYLSGVGAQLVSKDLPKKFNAELTDDDLDRVRMKLETAGLRLLSCDLETLPAEPAACRRVFEFGRKMGVETFRCNPPPEALDLVAKLAEEYGINVALGAPGQTSGRDDAQPDRLLKLCQGRSSRLGVSGDTGDWLRQGIDPVKAVRQLGPRLMALELHDVDKKSKSAREVTLGKGIGQIDKVIHELQRLQLKPAVITVGGPGSDSAAMPGLQASIEYCNRATLEVQSGKRP